MLFPLNAPRRPQKSAFCLLCLPTSLCPYSPYWVLGSTWASGKAGWQRGGPGSGRGLASRAEPGSSAYVRREPRADARDRPEWGRAEAAPPSGIWAASGGAPRPGRPRCVFPWLLWVERRRTRAPRGGERIRPPAAEVGAALRCAVRAGGGRSGHCDSPGDVTAAGQGRGAD